MDDQRSMSAEYCTVTAVSAAAAATASSTSCHRRAQPGGRASSKSMSPVGRVPPRSIASLPPVRVSFTGHGTRRASAEKNLVRSAGTSARIRVPRECGGGQELARPLDEPPEDVPIEAYARSARYTPRRAGPPRPHVRHARPRLLDRVARRLERQPLAHVEVGDGRRRRAVVPRVAVEVDALAPVHEPAEEPHDLAEARREVPVLAVGHGDAVEAEPVLAVGALQGAELDAL